MKQRKGFDEEVFQLDYQFTDDNLLEKFKDEILLVKEVAIPDLKEEEKIIE